MNPAKATAAKRGNSQGSVYQRENGRWSWQVTLGFDTKGKQKRRSGTASSKTEANKALAKVVADHARGRLVLPDKITVGEWFGQWLKDRKPSLADSTHSSYEWLIGKHITPWIGEHRLQALRPADLRQYYSSLASKQDEKGRTLSARTLRYIHGLIYSALKDALRLEIIERNIADVVQPEVPSEDRNSSQSMDGGGNRHLPRGEQGRSTASSIRPDPRTRPASWRGAGFTFGSFVFMTCDTRILRSHAARVWRSRSSLKSWATAARASRRTFTATPSRMSMTRRHSSFLT